VTKVTDMTTFILCYLYSIRILKTLFEDKGNKGYT